MGTIVLKNKWAKALNIILDVRNAQQELDFIITHTHSLYNEILNATKARTQSNTFHISTETSYLSETVPLAPTLALIPFFTSKFSFFFFPSTETLVSSVHVGPMSQAP